MAPGREGEIILSSPQTRACLPNLDALLAAFPDGAAVFWRLDATFPHDLDRRIT